MSDCNEDLSLTQCVDDHIDLIVPNCTREIHAANKCNQADKIQRITLLGYYRIMDYEIIVKETSCRRKCLSRCRVGYTSCSNATHRTHITYTYKLDNSCRLYNLGTINRMEARAIMENVGPLTSFLFFRYSAPKRIR